MTRLICSSDWHGDANTGGRIRYDDVREATEIVLRAMRDEKADGHLFLGDLSDPESVRSHLSAELATRFASRARQAGCFTRWIPGNHDVLEDGYGSSTLSALGGMLDGSTRLYAVPSVELMECGVTIVAFPFVALANHYDPINFVRAATLPEQANHDRIVVISHLNIEGIEPGSETTDMPRGRDVFLPVDEIRAKWPKALILQGHYHRRQVFNGVHVAGSICRLTFGEENNDPGYLIVEV